MPLGHGQVKAVAVLLDGVQGDQLSLAAWHKANHRGPQVNYSSLVDPVYEMGVKVTIKIVGEKHTNLPQFGGQVSKKWLTERAN